MSGSSLVLGTIEQFLTVMPLELRKKKHNYLPIPFIFYAKVSKEGS